MSNTTSGQTGLKEINLKELALDLIIPHKYIIDNELLKAVALDAIAYSGAKIYGEPKADVWSPHGLQYYVTITTSHLILTTYPEADYLTINYATCGDVSFEKFMDVIFTCLRPHKIVRQYETLRYPEPTCDFKPEDCKKYPACQNCKECKGKGGVSTTV